MTVTIRENDIIAFLQSNPEATVEMLTLQFPMVDLWTLRNVRREFRREHAVAELPPEVLIESAGLEGLSKIAKAALRAGFFRPIKLELRDRPRVKPILKQGGWTVGVMSDIHAPDQDDDALDVAVQVMQAAGVDELALNGDSFDAHSVSKYTVAAHRPMRWVEERALAVPVLAMIREEFPEIPVHFLYGNHDVRPVNYISAQAPQLQGLFDLPTILGITDLGFSFPEGNRLLIGDSLLIKHGVKVAGEAGDSVKKEVRSHGMSVHMGHVHRLAYYGVTRTAQVLRDEQPIFGVEGGCLQNLRPDYLIEEETANWQHGVTIYTVHDNGLVIPELVPIFGGRAYFRGHQFVSRLAGRK